MFTRLVLNLLFRLSLASVIPLVVVFLFVALLFFRLVLLFLLWASSFLAVLRLIIQFVTLFLALPWPTSLTCLRTGVATTSLLTR